MTTTVKANCNACGGERNAYIRASYSKKVGPSGPDDPTWSVTTIEALECCGCNQLSMRRKFWFSEWVELDGSGGMEIIYWPPKQAREPDWHDRLLFDDNLCQAMKEVYVALNQGLVVLASIGVRTLLDRSFFLLLKEDHGSFAKKLNIMVEKGLLLEGEKEIFQSIADVGNAAAHRAHVPTQETLIKILAAVESFLYQKFILPGDAKAVEKDTRSPRSQAGPADLVDMAELAEAAGPETDKIPTSPGDEGDLGGATPMTTASSKSVK